MALACQECLCRSLQLRSNIIAITIQRSVLQSSSSQRLLAAKHLQQDSTMSAVQSNVCSR